MTPDEADEQVAGYLRTLGATAPASLPVSVRVGEALLGFAHADGVLAVTTLVYRFRAAPRPAVLAGARDAATPGTTGGGRLALDDRALVLRRDVAEPVPDAVFAGWVAALADAGLEWAHHRLARAAEAAAPTGDPPG